MPFTHKLRPHPPRYRAMVALLVLIGFLEFSNPTWADPLVKSDVFVGGESGYHTYRIPALVVSNAGTALAFCEGRKDSASDQGNIDLVLKRSHDGGTTWEGLQLIHEEGGDAPITIGNPVPIVVHDDDTIHLLFTRNNKRLFYTQSQDDGQTWRAPRELTDILAEVPFSWLRIGTGPVHGIQLRNTQLAVPIWYCDEEPHAKEKRYRAGVLLGDATGTTWQAGGLVPENIPKLNECTVLERKDGSLLLNMRGYRAGYRSVAHSNDGGATWSDAALMPSLPDTTCQGSLLRLQDGRVLFSNVPGNSREKLSLTLSQDDGQTWGSSQVLEPSPSAYADLAQRVDGTVLCLYERGEQRYNERISVARIPLSWLQQVTEP